MTTFPKNKINDWKGTAYRTSQIITDEVTIGTNPSTASNSNGVVQCHEVNFTENGAGTYTGAVTLPAGATLVDIIIHGTALWTAATSASMEIGDATDPDGFFTAVNLKATDLLAGESLSFTAGGTSEVGAYIANSQVSQRYSATARTITATVVSVGAGTAGRTRVTFLWSKPSTTPEATKA